MEWCLCERFHFYFVALKLHDTFWRVAVTFLGIVSFWKGLIIDCAIDEMKCIKDWSKLTVIVDFSHGCFLLGVVVSINTPNIGLIGILQVRKKGRPKHSWACKMRQWQQWFQLTNTLSSNLTRKIKVLNKYSVRCRRKFYTFKNRNNCFSHINIVC